MGDSITEAIREKVGRGKRGKGKTCFHAMHCVPDGCTAYQTVKPFVVYLRLLSLILIRCRLPTDVLLRTCPPFAAANSPASKLIF